MASEDDNQAGDPSRRRDRPAPAWGRRQGESDRAHALFIFYRDLGPDRSLEKLHRTCTGPAPKIDALKQMSGRNRWVERCRAWDDHVQSAKDRATIAHAMKWERRRLEAIEKTWTLTDELAAKVERMLAFPLQTTRAEDNGRTIHIHPAGWSYATIAVIAKTLVEIRAVCLTAAIRPANEYTQMELLAMKGAREQFMIGLIEATDHQEAV